jgi:hypothetical protein
MLDKMSPSQAPSAQVYSPLSHSSSLLGMAAASNYATRVSTYEYLHRPSSPAASLATSLSPTLVNNTHYLERPSIKLRIPSGASNILNSVVVNAAGQFLYSISSNSKHTTFVSCMDNVEVATVQWERSSPRMVFRRKKIKCKAWLPLTGPQNEYILTPYVIRNLNMNVIPPGLACSHTAMHGLLGCRGPPLVMWVSAPAKLLYTQANILVTVNPCQQTRSRSSSMAHQFPYG